MSRLAAITAQMAFGRLLLALAIRSVVECCSVLQCAAVCRSMLYCIMAQMAFGRLLLALAIRSVAECCSVLQYVAVCFTVLWLRWRSVACYLHSECDPQCCSSVLQSVAVCLQ